MSSYRRASQWHIDFDESSNRKKQDSENSESSGMNGSEDDGEKVENDKEKSLFDRQYIRSKLDQGLNRIWQVCFIVYQSLL